MPESLPADLAKLLASPSRADRRRAIETIAGRRLAEALPQLEKIAASDRENDVRILADRVARFLREEGLVPTPAPSAPPELEPVIAALRALKADARMEAARQLAEARSPAAVPALIERAWGERDVEVKVLLARALSASADLPQRGPVVGALEQAFLVDLEPKVRRAALLALDALDAREAAHRIIERRRDDDPGCRALAEALLERWGVETVLTAARSMLLSPTIGTREAAVRALAASRRPEAVPLLAWAVTDPLPLVSDAAREGLTELAAMGIEPAAEAVRAAGRGPRAAGVAAGAAMSGEPSPAHHDPVESQTSTQACSPQPAAGGERHREPRSRAVAPRAPRPQPTASPQPPPATRDPLESAEPARRLQEIREIVARGDAARAPALISRLSRESDPFVQSALVNALGRLQAAGILPSFVPLLDSPDQRVRANAVEAIGWLGSIDDRRRLVPLLADRNNRVRANAVVACHGLPGVDVRPALEEMLASTDVWARKSAVYAIRTLADPELARLLKGEK